MPQTSPMNWMMITTMFFIAMNLNMMNLQSKSSNKVIKKTMMKMNQKWTW